MFFQISFREASAYFRAVSAYFRGVSAYFRRVSAYFARKLVSIFFERSFRKIWGHYGNRGFTMILTVDAREGCFPSVRQWDWTEHCTYSGAQMDSHTDTFFSFGNLFPLPQDICCTRLAGRNYFVSFGDFLCPRQLLTWIVWDLISNHTFFLD